MTYTCLCVESMSPTEQMKLFIELIIAHKFD